MPDGDFNFHAEEVDSRLLRDAFGKFATGVTIVTCDSGIGPLGMTANSFSSVSLDPPLVLWSAAKSSQRCAAFERAHHFAIHVLSDAQVEMCKGFARQGDDFSGLDWSLSQNRVPLLADHLARFECTQHAVYDGGDHSIILGRVTSVTVKEGAPLVFAGGAFGQLSRMDRD